MFCFSHTIKRLDHSAFRPFWTIQTTVNIQNPDPPVLTNSIFVGMPTGPKFEWSEFQIIIIYAGFQMVNNRLFCHECNIFYSLFFIKWYRLVIYCCPDTFVRFSNAKWLPNHLKTRQFVPFSNGPLA
jgi:hypothetical protein